MLIHDFLELGSIPRDLYIPIPDNFYTDLCKTGVFWVSETFFSSFQLAALDRSISLTLRYLEWCIGYLLLYNKFPQNAMA